MTSPLQARRVLAIAARRVSAILATGPRAARDALRAAAAPSAAERLGCLTNAEVDALPDP